MRGRISSTVSLFAIALAAGAATPPAGAATAATAAQQAEAPAEVVVGPDGARLHCGPSPRMYTVASLSPGQTLRVLGEQRGMLAVAYPQDASAFVPAESVLREGGGRVTLVEPSRLVALHAAKGPGASWNSLLDEPLEAGTTLTVRGSIKDDAGSVIGYRVEAPAGAVAYVDPDAVLEPGEEPAEPTAEAADPPEQPRDAGRSAPQQQPQAPAAPDGVQTLLEPIVAPGQQAQPADPPPFILDQSRAADPASGERPAAAGDRGALSLDELDQAYAEARATGWDDAELEALLEEHSRALEAMEVSPFTERTRRQLRQRIAFLEMRIRYREGPGRLAREREGAPSLSAQMRERIKELEADAAYLVVGRLVPSRVYDGERLPRLYRLESADSLGRTLGYLEPDRDLDLQGKLGDVVGIIGSYEQAEDSPMRMIRPTHVKRLGSR